MLHEINHFNDASNILLNCTPDKPTAYFSYKRTVIKSVCQKSTFKQNLENGNFIDFHLEKYTQLQETKVGWI